MALTTVPLCLVETPEGVKSQSSHGPIALLMVSFLFSLLTGCGIDGITSGEAALSARVAGTRNSQATISLSPLKLAFTATQGGSNPPGQAIAISNSGNGKFAWSVSSNAPWLALFPTSGTGAGSFSATAIIPGLAAGTYSVTITVTATGATNTPQTIPVSLTVSAASTPSIQPSSLSLSPVSLSLSATQGGSNPSGAVAISNAGSGMLSWTVSTDATWLYLSPTSGIAPSSFSATANITGMAAGSYTATITLTAMGATPQTIPVSLIVTASQATTTSATLSWSPHPDPTIVGFFVHYGTGSPNSPESCTYAQGTYFPLSSMTASSPGATISNLATGSTYYFAVSSYNGSLESACSNEVTKTM